MLKWAVLRDIWWIMGCIMTGLLVSGWLQDLTVMLSNYSTLISVRPFWVQQNMFYICLQREAEGLNAVLYIHTVISPLCNRWSALPRVSKSSFCSSVLLSSVELLFFNLNSAENCPTGMNEGQNTARPRTSGIYKGENHFLEECNLQGRPKTLLFLFLVLFLSLSLSLSFSFSFSFSFSLSFSFSFSLVLFPSMPFPANLFGWIAVSLSRWSMNLRSRPVSSRFNPARISAA